MTSTILPLSEPYGPAHLWDAGRGEPLVLVHGVGMQLAAWQPQIDAFQERYRVIALDLPGHGRTAPLEGQPALADYVDWLRAVLQALDVGPVNLVGHSLGALIAGGFTIEHPQSVGRLAVLNAVLNRTADARAAVEARAAAIAKGDIDLEAPTKRWFRDTPGDKALADKVRGWLSEVDITAYAQAYHAFAHGDDTYAASWPTVCCPVLALTADGDPNSTPEMSLAIADAAPEGQAQAIRGHRHMVSLTDPAGVNTALTEWLERTTQTTGEQTP